MAHQDSARGSRGEPIAIVGSGFRLPGSSNSPSKLWELLLKPRDLRSRIPDSRFDPETFYHPDPSHHGTTDVTESYFLDQDHRHFDANFFNIKPVEAHAIDPQQRLLMEVVYESLEASGLSIESLAGSPTGVYVGLMCADYLEHLHSDMNSAPTYTGTGNARSIMSNRISYFFDWHGPSMTIDTACSSSLVAVHQAVQLLRAGDANVAIAAGANMMLGPLQYIGASKLHMLSADSRCRMWDAEASGYARGEGVAAVVLKRLSDAIADGDEIECIIRESGVNQDGRTKGITMPSATAQVELIRRTYAKAGLDPENPSQRCQYFEAHGTGTAAGDPKEAEAISKSFFRPGEDVTNENGEPLYVGSIKTIVGHTEGTAGLAGLLKASLAIQHGVIPPNYLFNTLHPAVEPFYTNLQVLREPKAWPKLPEGTPRRASVNSFGFGGTNAHVIIELFSPESTILESERPTRQLTPFTFSAASEKSLRGILTDYSAYIQAHPDVRLPDLSYTLHHRRSEHTVRISISASSASDLEGKIGELLAGDITKSIGVRAKALSRPARVLGIFTGQGAQWPTMGRQLITSIPHVEEIVRELDFVLQSLPEAERPDWSLMDELLCDAPASRLASAAIAQPLCTAVQIILHDLLVSSGLKFDAVVGHSSGEIAAAYAAGYISRDDALKIAYYRGYFTHLADRPGGMMAVGTSRDDAAELCDLPMFQGRLAVAAVNAASSVTISGDLDAINEAKDVLEDEGKFARVLKVDKAYHSSHMVPCSEAYIHALVRCNIQPRSRAEGPAWFSSTFEGRKMHADPDILAQYWADNMVKPVLFSSAVASAAEVAHDVAIEVGPHAALKGPALETLPQGIPYTGLLHRGKDDLKAFSDALGYLWSHFIPPIVQLRKFDAHVSGHQPRKVIKGLPTYHWNHDTLFWHGSRASNVFLHRKSPPNPLLGTRTADIMEREMRWKNYLRLSELPWVRGHALQGQIIFPATAYIATAVEAARHLVPRQEQERIAVVEVQDFDLGRPLVFREDDSGIETLFTLSDISRDVDGSYSASFIYYACSSSGAEALSAHATGRIIVTTGEPSSEMLPCREDLPPNTVSIPEDRFYASLQPLGYEYSGSFRTLSSIRRRLNFASANIRVPLQDDAPEQMLLHPAVLDSALQGIFLAYSWPGDGSLEQLHVPTGINRLCINVPQCRLKLLPGTDVATCSRMTGNPLATKNLEGDVDIYAEDGTGLVQFEGIRVVAFAESSSSMDRAIFSEHKWEVAVPDPELAMNGARATEEDYKYAYAMERVCIYYMKRVVTLFPEEGRETMNLQWHFLCLFDFFQDVLDSVQANTRQSSFPIWLQDTEADLLELKVQFGHRVDMRLAFAVGDNLPAVLRGETTMLEHMTKDNLLDRFYETGLGLREFSVYLSRTVKQLAHSHPRMNILEIGAGTGGATKMVMGDIGRSFSSYTYTDISTGFFETAQDVFSAYSDKMVFKTLNVENDVLEQGFVEHSYDLIVASLVLHATSDLNLTLQNARRLLKPGGYLIMTEVANNDVCRVGFMMSALPGWWLGQNDGRKLSPCVSTVQWHQLLLQNGFDGVNSSTPDADAIPFPLAVIVSQAVDSQVAKLHDSLSPAGMNTLLEEDGHLVFIGGQSLSTLQLIESIVRLIQPFGIRHTIIKTLADVATLDLSSKSTILCLAELDEPVFKTLSPKAFAGLQNLFELEKTILWITQGCRSEDPYMNMMVGLGRSLVLENSDLTLQFLDLQVGLRPDARVLLEALLRLRWGDALAKDGSLDTMLWKNELELAYENGKLMVSRVYHSKDLNDRYNSCRRTIFGTMNPQVVPIEIADAFRPMPKIVRNESLAALMSEHQTALAVPETLIKISHSLLTPPTLALSTQSYLALGINTRTNQSVVAITDSISSFALASPNRALDVQISKDNVQHFLPRLHTQLQVAYILSLCPRNSTLLVLEPSSEVASSLAQYAAGSNIAVLFAAADPVVKGGPWIHLDRYSPTRVIRSSLPPNIAVFLDCTTGSQSERIGAVITSCLPRKCLRVDNGELQNFGDMSPECFDTAVHRALGPTNAPVSPLSVVSPLDVQSGINPSTPVIVDWTASSAISVQLSTVDSQVTFKDDRTYVLFGLTSDLALSICEWMISRGARNIVLTSRNPDVSHWTEVRSQLGVKIEAYANDITDYKSLSALVAQIRRDWPPIAGIAHGAMVLDDVAFFEMPFEKMQKVLQPKVKGAIHLDQLFQDASLDFFILFSSATAIVGNRGQSAYTAANMFMSALATQRRAKGLAASILHLGAVVGVGYINRGFSEAILAMLRKTGFMTLSERDLHLCFGEVVLASHALSGRNPDVVAAAWDTAQLGEDGSPPWSKLARFQTLLDADKAQENKTSKRAAVASTRSQLLDATTSEDVFDIVSEALFRKLQLSLQLPTDHQKTHVLSLATDELGIDSLVAVEIRSWFMKEIETDIPVFRILSGGSVAQLLEYAVENMPVKLTPHLESTPQQDPSPKISTAASGTPALIVKQPTESIDSSPSTPSSLSDDGVDTGAEFSPLLTDQSERSDTPVSSVHSLSEQQRIAPISPGQSRFWFLKDLIEDQTAANSTIWVAVNGSIQLDRMDRALQRVALRHEALRTAFILDEDRRPVQAIADTSRLRIEHLRINQEIQVTEEFDKLKTYVYDIENGDCMRLVYLSSTTNDGHLLIGFHHIIMDGISLEVFLNDLQKAYSGQSLDQAYQYTDYSERLTSELARGAMQSEVQYWKSEFTAPSEPLPLLPFAATKTRRPLTAYGSTSISRTLSPVLAAQIQSFCRELKANPFHFYLGVFGVLLSKLLSISDVCIGMADANRLNDNVTDSIGMYLNLLPLRFHLEQTQDFADLLKDVRRKAYLALAHSKLPFDTLLDSIQLERSAAFTPLFQAFINYRQGFSETREFDGATGSIKEMSLPKAGYDISLDINENPGHDTRITFMLQESLYSDNDAKQVLDMYFKILHDLSSAAKQPIKDVSLFSTRDVDAAQQLGRGVTMRSKWPENMAARMHDVIAEHSDDIAITETTGRTWTYEQLDAEVNRIAAAIPTDVAHQPVAVLLEPSGLLICSLLAIMRLGGIYVPLDSNMPPARLSAMLAECNPRALLVSTSTARQLGELELSQSVLRVDVSDLPRKDAPTIRPASVQPSDSAAIFFTSGTAGVPKGVVLSHGSIVNYLQAVSEMHSFGTETVLQQSSVGFDMSLDQIFMALAHGGNLVIVPEALRKDFSSVAEIITKHNITYTIATPSEYLAWFRHGHEHLSKSTSWTFARAGGEIFSRELFQAFKLVKNRFDHPFHAFNAYGPTEATMSATELEINLDAPEGSSISAGTSIANVNIYIVDGDLQPLPVGFEGEICTAGAGVALGYLGDADVSRGAFIRDPKASEIAIEKGWDRMYRTGDKGKLLHDGLHILGRINGDTQVKLRGLRIEMHDVERSILDTSKGLVRDVVVTPRAESTILVAHAVLSAEASLANAMEYLRQLAASLPLPQYMRPAAIISVDSLPLTAAGKIDRKALEKLSLPTAIASQDGSTAQLTKAETKLVEVWRQILPPQMHDVHVINQSSDFFNIGGNSMLLIELRELLKKTFEVELQLLQLFEHSTVGAMASALQKSSVITTTTDWEIETRVPSDYSQVITQPNPNSRGPRTIVITGATGFLGINIVRLLARDPSIDKVYCIAVRKQEKLAEFATVEKVVIYSGDLSLPRCGLSEDDADIIFSTADAIIHNGADVSFLKSYDSLKASNLTSTKELARLALRRGTPFHYISTASAGKFNKSAVLAPESLASHQPIDLKAEADGYAASKWASEVFLEKVHSLYALPVCIHRPSSIFGPEAGEDDIVSNMLRYAPIIKALPDTRLWTGFIDFISIEKAARSVVRVVLQDKSNESSVRYQHHGGERVIPAHMIAQTLVADQETPWGSVPMSEWVDQAIASGMDPLVGEFLRSIDKGTGLQIGQKLLIDASHEMESSRREGLATP